MSSPVNETLVRDIITEVLDRLGGSPVSAPAASSESAAPPACGCGGTKTNNCVTSKSRQGQYGIFQDTNEACDAAQSAYRQLQEKGMAARSKIVEIVKEIGRASCRERV